MAKAAIFPVCILVGLLLSNCAYSQRQAAPQSSKSPRPNPLKLPSTMPLDEFESTQLYPFLNQRAYLKLQWDVDKSVRDTGPYIRNIYYGTHPAVRIYYSPKMVQWLEKHRHTDLPVPDGAMMVKEMFPPPAARYEDLSEEEINHRINNQKLPEQDQIKIAWTTMIKDSAGARDGWFWSYYGPGQPVDEPTDKDGTPVFRESGFGLYCVRCHGSAEKESTFAALDNIKGFPGNPLEFRVDDSWRDISAAQKPWELQMRPRLVGTEHGRAMLKLQMPESADTEPPVNDDFAGFFHSISPVERRDIRAFPSEFFDHVPSPKDGPAKSNQQYFTSTQCMSCHGALTGAKNTAGAFGPTMFLQTGPRTGEGVNVSPYGEWRWSPMGLAGRDPVFYSQLEGELAWLDQLPDDQFVSGNETRKNLKRSVRNTCLSCHGAMGKRQFDRDHPDDRDFHLEWIYATPQDDPKHAKYGALARDGISCTVCHHIVADEKNPSRVPSLFEFLSQNTTGHFQSGKPDELFGPFEDKEIVTLPMENSLGIKPKHSKYLQSSRLCGSCHTIDLPVFDAQKPIGDDLSKMEHSIEQATYLEWLNSDYQDEYPDADNYDKTTAKSCQQCHMPGGFHNQDIDIEQLQTRIAIIQDESYPEAEHALPSEKIRARFRTDGYRRHRHQGLNVVLLEMFRQFNKLLGVGKNDYMSGATTDLPNAIDSYAQQATERTATINIVSVKTDGDEIVADVDVTNLTGHRFPSGVGFRRAFIEFSVLDTSGGSDQVIWSSGSTDRLGLIVDGDTKKVLASETFRDGQWQPHYNVIDRQDQVQTYEELVKNADDQFTVSFVRRDKHVKDNRLLPKGWKTKPSYLDGPQLERYLKATHPDGKASSDPKYSDGRGSDRITYRVPLSKQDFDPGKLKVRASLHYQSLAPYFLHLRFSKVPDGEATKRLHYLLSRLNVKETPINGWKLTIGSSEKMLTQ